MEGEDAGTRVCWEVAGLSELRLLLVGKVSRAGGLARQGRRLAGAAPAGRPMAGTDLRKWKSGQPQPGRPRSSLIAQPGRSISVQSYIHNHHVAFTNDSTDAEAFTVPSRLWDHPAPG